MMMPGLALLIVAMCFLVEVVREKERETERDV